MIDFLNWRLLCRNGMLCRSRTLQNGLLIGNGDGLREGLAGPAGGDA